MNTRSHSSSQSSGPDFDRFFWFLRHSFFFCVYKRQITGGDVFQAERGTAEEPFEFLFRWFGHKNDSRIARFGNPAEVFENVL